MASTDDLAADLGVDEGDVILLRRLGEQTRRCPTSSRRREQILTRMGSAPHRPDCYWPGADGEPRKRFGLGGPDPTAPEGDRPGW